jgi:hypothetical protein
LPTNQTRQFTATRVKITPSRDTMARTTTPRPQRSPTSGQTNSLIASYVDLRSLQRLEGHYIRRVLEIRRESQRQVDHPVIGRVMTSKPRIQLPAELEAIAIP